MIKATHEVEPGSFDVLRLEDQYTRPASETVDVRFLLNEFAARPKDVEEIVALGLGLRGRLGSFLDVGTASGKFPYRLSWEFGFEGDIYGVEPYSNQTIKQYGGLTWLEREVVAKRLISIGEEDASSAFTVVDRLRTEANEPLVSAPVHFMKAWADRLDQFEDNSIDYLSMMFMLYHLTPEQQTAAILEAMRVMKPGGILIGGTSGGNNKTDIRGLEVDLSIALGDGTVPPPHMNTGFTTEKAKEFFPQHFKHIFVFEQDDIMIIDTLAKAEIVAKSLYSLIDQFSPRPNCIKFEKALKQVMQARVLRDIFNSGAFYDNISRSIFICSNQPFSPEDEASMRATGFVPLERPESARE